MYKLLDREAAESEQKSNPRPAQDDAEWAKAGAARHHVYITGEHDPEYNCLEWAIGSTTPVLNVDSGCTLEQVLAAYNEKGYEPCGPEAAEIDLWGGPDPRPKNRTKGPHPGRLKDWSSPEDYQAAHELWQNGSAPVVVAHAARNPSDRTLRVQSKPLKEPDSDVKEVQLPPQIRESKLGQMERVTHPRFGLTSVLSVGLGDSLMGYGKMIAHLRKRQ